MRQLETIRLELSELEAMRLCDLDGLDQEAAGIRMGVSRGTIQRLLKDARVKVLRALLESRALLIEERAHHEDLYESGCRRRSRSRSRIPGGSS